MDAALVNQWLMAAVGIGVAGVGGWAWFWRKREGVTNSKASIEFVQSTMKQSRAWQQDAREADARAKSSEQMMQLEKRRADDCELRDAERQRQIRSLQDSLHNLAMIVVEVHPSSAPFVRQWIKDSGYPPLADS